MNWQFLIFFVIAVAVGLAIAGPEHRREFALDFTMWFNKVGKSIAKKGRYLLHVLIGIALGVVTVAALYWFDFTQFKGMAWYELGVLFLFGGFFGTIVLWEGPRWLKGRKNGEWTVPFDWRDCRMSGYGYAIGGIVALEVLKILT